MNVKDCDKIFVLKDSEIIEQGDHKSLLELNGLYTELWRKETIVD